MIHSDERFSRMRSGPPIGNESFAFDELSAGGGRFKATSCRSGPRTGLLSAAVACSLAPRAKQSSMPVMGYLEAGSPEASANLVDAFRKGLSEAGYVEGRNVAIEFRWVHNQNDRLSDLAANLVRRRGQVITQISSLAASAARSQRPRSLSSSIPVPTRLELASSLASTGWATTSLIGRQIEYS